MRDPAARIRADGAHVVRTLRAPLKSGDFLLTELARRWADERRVVDHEVIEPTVVRARRIPFVTQPHEWCDAQLFSAALLTLELQKAAVAEGYDLKDASAWNVIFEGCHPVFCDLLSFEPLHDRRWWAMGQYARHFLLPLLVSRKRRMRAHQTFTAWRDGLSTEMARGLLGRGVYVSRHATLFLGGSIKCGESVNQPPDADGARHIRRFRDGLHGALDWMLAGVAPRTQREGTGSAWSAYEGDRPHYGGESLALKRSWVANWLALLRPEWVVDMGCNQGEFSRMALAVGANVVAVDADHDSIQRLYLANGGSDRLYPVIAQLDDVSAGRGWAGVEHPGLAPRLGGRFDLVMMLALVHHLAIGAAIPLDEVAKFARGCTRGWVIVEFLHETDPQLLSLCVQRRRAPEEFSLDRQREAFLAAGFILEAEIDLSPARRSLALLRHAA